MFVCIYIVLILNLCLRDVLKKNEVDDSVVSSRTARPCSVPNLIFNLLCLIGSGLSGIWTARATKKPRVLLTCGCSRLAHVRMDYRGTKGTLAPATNSTYSVRSEFDSLVTRLDKKNYIYNNTQNVLFKNIIIV
jgi:hypothetical protein